MRQDLVNVFSIMNHLSYKLHTYLEAYDSEGNLLEYVCARKDITFLQRERDEIREGFTEEEHKNLQIISWNDCFYCSRVPSSGGWYVIGPVGFSSLIPMKFRKTGNCISREKQKLLAKHDFMKYSENLAFLYNLYHDSFLGPGEIVRLCCIPEVEKEEIQKLFSQIVFDSNEMGKHHNPYDQELREQKSIEQGDLEMLKKSIAEDFVGDYGVLAKDYLRSQKNTAIAVITLASRSAIRGGIPPETAYSLSDSYIVKIEGLTSAHEILRVTRMAEYEYAGLVREMKRVRQGIEKTEKNPYVNQCKNYIFSHLHEKITVQSLAEGLGMNANYLSEIFKQCEGISLSSYIMHEKINRAKNLLIYSQYSYIEIAAYLGFSSQSHLGTQFKKITGMTLSQYRKKYAPIQFHENT